MFYLFICQGM